MIGFKWHRVLAVLAIAALAFTPVAYGQRPTGDLRVMVDDTDGNDLPGVTVTVTGQGAPKVQVTNENGQAFFPGLDPAALSLVATLDGFSTVEFPNVQMSANRTTTIEVTMSAAVEEVITVTSESPLLDENRVQSGTTVSQVELEKIPTARDPWSILAQTQGVSVDRINVGGNESGQQSSFTAPGVSDSENSFLVDGVEITDMAAVGSSATYYDFDQFTEMQFGTGGADVTKSAAGVSVNLITKRGTNEFRGSARFLRTDDNMFDTFTQSVPVLQAPNAELGPGQSGFIGNSINQVTEYGFEAGGPVLRDKLWFWGSFGTNDIRNRTGGADTTDVQSDDTVLENTSFKVNAQVSSNNSALGSWNNGNKLKFGRNASPTRPAPTTWDQRGPSAVIRFEDTHVFSSNFFLGGAYGKVDGGFQLTSKAVKASSLTTAPETSWDSNGVWGNSYLSGGSSRPSEEFKIDGSYFFNTGDINHELKFGTRLREFETVSPFFWPGRDVFHVSSEVFNLPDSVMEVFYGSPDAEFLIAHAGQTPLTSTSYSSVWAQDTISSGKWTVNAGFRYDLQEGRNEQFSRDPNPAFGDVLSALNFPGEDGVFDWTNISPRLGVTYALGEERKTLLRASYSQFPEQLQTGDISRQNPISDTYATFVFFDEDGDDFWDGDCGGSFNGGVGCTGEDIIFDFIGPNANSLSVANRTDPGLDAPVTDELLLSVEHAFLPEFVVGVNLTFRDTNDVLEARTLIEDPDTGQIRTATRADYEEDRILTGILPDGTAYSVPQFSLFCGSGCRRNGTLLLNGDRSQLYQGGGVTFTKRLSNRWMARGYINYGETEWDVPASYFANQDPTDFEGGFDNDGGLFAVQAAGSGAKANVFIQSTWQYNINGMYQVAPDRPWGFNVAANIFGREGTPLPYFVRSRSTDRVTSDVQVTREVDSFRSDDVLTVDLRLEKEFAATGNVGFTVSLDAFNLFDENYTLQRERRLGTSQSDWLRETLSPRIWRIGVRLNWR